MGNLCDPMQSPRSDSISYKTGCHALNSTYVSPCFFFQAEDGIRDVAVTGVQTCALPISHRRPHPPGHLLLYVLCGRALWLLEHVRAKGQDHHLLRAGAPDWMRRLVGPVRA